ncbi:MAG: S8 family serine peptidase [Candidatus Omnitrophica bacterium]|nr:S8 family serine peptidase [Candidatus Omnitrophota bacterium]
MIVVSPKGKIFRSLFLFSLVFLFTPFFSGAGSKIAPEYKEGEVLVKFKKSFGLTAAKTAYYGIGTAVVTDFPFISGQKGQPYLHLRSDRLTTQELLAQIKNDPRVESVSPNYIIRVAQFPYDERFGELWGLHNTGQKVNGVFGTVGADIDAPPAWDVSTGDPAVVVAVIDTGVDFSHEDLSANMWTNPGEISGNALDDDFNGYKDDVYGINAITGTGNPSDDHGHGTHVSGTIAGVGGNGKGVTGVNWQARIMGVKSFNSSGSGTTADSITAIEYVTDMKINHGVNVVAINASWGGGGFSQLQADAIEAAGDAGIIFVAAAGNSGFDSDATPFYPASYNLTNIVSVAATDQNDNLAGFSNYGLVNVDLAAPGVNILSTLPGIVALPGTEPFFDNMESDTAKWVSGGAPNTWARTVSRFHSETYSWTDSPAGDYPNNANSYLSIASDVDLSAYSAEPDLRLRFWANVALEKGADFLYVEISKDSGANFSQLGVISDQNAAWTLYSYQIPVDYWVKEFRFRFHLVADASVNYDGVYIDDVGIAHNFGAGSNDYGFSDGTSMAAPHVTGAIALVSAVHPTDSPTQKINRVLSGVDRLAGLEGVVATAGRLNLNNILGSGNTFKITGTITTTAAGNPALAKVLVKLVDLSLGDTVLTDTVMTDTTNASGQYSLFGQKTRKYKVVPELAGYKFSPVYHVIDSLTADTILNFRAGDKVYALSGVVTRKDTLAGLSGVDLTLSDTYPYRIVRTIAGGSFSLGDVLPGSYNFVPKLEGWVFTPSSRAVTVLNDDIPELNFSASLKITLTTPYGSPNPVLKGGTATCTVGATNILGNPSSYLWTAGAGYFLELDGVTSSGATSTLPSPVWVAPVSFAPLELLPVLIEVEVSCNDGGVAYASFWETVSQTIDIITPDIGGTEAVGPVAAGISALLAWRKRRKRRE